MAAMHAGWQTNTERSRWTHTSIPQMPLVATAHYLHSAAQSPPPPVSSYLFSQPPASSPILIPSQSSYQSTGYYPLSSSLPLHAQPSQQPLVHPQQPPPQQAQSAGFFHRLGSHFSSLLPFSFSLPSFPLPSLQQSPHQPTLPSQHSMARRDSRYLSHTSHYHDTLAPPTAHRSRASPSRSSSATSSIHSSSTHSTSSRGSHHPRSGTTTAHRHERRRHRRTPSASVRTASVGSEARKEDQEGLIKVNTGEYLQHGRCQPRALNTATARTEANTHWHSLPCACYCLVHVFLYVDKVLGVAGQGTFGTVLDVYDIKHQQRLALKVVRSVQRYLEAAAIEIEILEKLRAADPRKESSALDRTHPLIPHQSLVAHLLTVRSCVACAPVSLCVRLYRDFELHHSGQRHVCIGTEKLGRSLYEFLKKNQYRGFQLHSVRLFAYQLISAVAFCHSIGLIHTDLKVSRTPATSLSAAPPFSQPRILLTALCCAVSVHSPRISCSPTASTRL